MQASVLGMESPGNLKKIVGDYGFTVTSPDCRVKKNPKCPL